MLWSVQKSRSLGESCSDFSSSCNPCRSCSALETTSLDSVTDSNLVNFFPPVQTFVRSCAQQTLCVLTPELEIKSKSEHTLPDLHIGGQKRHWASQVWSKWCWPWPKPIWVCFQHTACSAALFRTAQLVMDGDFSEQTSKERASLLSVRGTIWTAYATTSFREVICELRTSASLRHRRYRVPTSFGPDSRAKVEGPGPKRTETGQKSKGLQTQGPLS